jgi:UDPglucose 6-dehydrogenase
MRVGVLGMGHLGQVTAACLASLGHQVWCAGRPVPIGHEEPELEAMRARGAEAGAIRACEDFSAAAPAVLWVTVEPPVDAMDRADVGVVAAEVLRVLLESTRAYARVLISSQVPAGTTRALAQRLGGAFAYSPENLRRKHAVHDFLHPARIVCGTADGEPDAVLEQLLAPIARIEWMRMESAECVKHALNALLGACIALTNEAAELFRLAGGAPADVERALRSEPRIGVGLPVRAGEAFTGGTLGRDLQYLVTLGEARGLPMTLARAVLESNRRHLGQS